MRYCIYIYIYIYAIYSLKGISKICLIVTRIQKLCQTLLFVFLINYQFVTKTNVYKEYIDMRLCHSYIIYTHKIYRIYIYMIYNIYIHIYICIFILIYTVSFMTCYA